MDLRRWNRWLLGAALTVLPSGSGTALQAEPPSDRTAPSKGPISSCAWTPESAQRVLARSLGELSAHDETVGNIAERLVNDYGVPLSFIESDEDVKISFARWRPTVQQVLEKIVELAPVYRYATIAGHLVLYPQGTKWDVRLDGLHIGPGPRDRVALKLTDELERQLPAFANFGTNLSGNHNSYVFLDRVSVVGSGSVVELLVQLLGARPSAIFSINKLPLFPSAMLFLGGVHYWQTVKLTSPTKIMHPGDTAQLKVIGIFPDGTRQDVTAGECGTVYLVTDERVLSVSADGLVTARVTGEAWVEARNADQVNSVGIQVVKPASSVTGGSAAPPPGARPRPQGGPR
jgi:hypothetical protein